LLNTPETVVPKTLLGKQLQIVFPSSSEAVSKVNIK